MDVSRRDFIRLGTSAAVTTTAVAQAGGAQSAPVLLAQSGQALPLGFDPADPGLKFDLVIANGEVLDPSQALRGKRDLGIKNGQVAAILPAIPADRSVQRIDAAGKLVVPGLIDLHTHLCPHLGIGLPADELVRHHGHDHGRVGGRCRVAYTFGNFHVTASCRSRARASSPSSTSRPSGWPAGSLPARCSISTTPTWTRCAKALVENADLVLGVKVRITDSVVGQNGLEPLRRAIRAAEIAGKPFRVMCHIGAAPGSLSDLLDLLRPGDILTHAYSGAGNNTVQNGQLLPARSALGGLAMLLLSPVIAGCQRSLLLRWPSASPAPSPRGACPARGRGERGTAQYVREWRNWQTRWT